MLIELGLASPQNVAIPPCGDRPRRAPEDSEDSFALIPAARVAGAPEGTQ